MPRGPAAYTGASVARFPAVSTSLVSLMADTEAAVLGFHVKSSLCSGHSAPQLTHPGWKKAIESCLVKDGHLS